MHESNAHWRAERNRRIRIKIFGTDDFDEYIANIAKENKQSTVTTNSAVGHVQTTIVYEKIFTDEQTSLLP